MGNLFTLQRNRSARAARPAGRVHPEAGREFRHQTTQALGEVLRPKLTLGAPDDAQEREADAVAERVMRMPESSAAEGETLQRKCAACEEGDEEQLRRSPQPEEEEEEEVQARADGAGADAGPVAADTASRIQARRGGGTPLPASERGFFEPRFGADFGRVRLHAGPEATALSDELSARAFTVGGDMFFGRGEYRPGTPTGRQLLAHELTHVLQQRGRTEGRVRRVPDLVIPEERGVRELRQQSARRADIRLFTPLVESRVLQYIAEAMRTGGDARGAFSYLNGLRNGGGRRSPNCYDSSLVAAEHYMYARSEVAAGGRPAYAQMMILIPLYQLAKLFEVVPPTGVCPVSPVNADVLLWGYRGANDGLADHDRPGRR